MCYTFFQMLLKVLSWNIWRGGDLDEVIKLLSKVDGDIISLQEVAVIKHINQAEEIARRLGLNWFYCKAFTDDRHDSPSYDLGNAILTKFPVNGSSCHLLSGLDLYKQSLKFSLRSNYKGDSETEPRGAVQVELTAGGKILTIVNTHLAYSKDHKSSKIRDIQLDNLLNNPAIKQSSKLILTGDFNSIPESETIKKIESMLINTDKNPAHPTWNDKRIDYIFISPDIIVKSFQILNSDASDHFPILAEIEI